MSSLAAEIHPAGSVGFAFTVVLVLVPIVGCTCITFGCALWRKLRASSVEAASLVTGPDAASDEVTSDLPWAREASMVMKQGMKAAVALVKAPNDAEAAEGGAATVLQVANELQSSLLIKSVTLSVLILQTSAFYMLVQAHASNQPSPLRPYPRA